MKKVIIRSLIRARFVRMSREQATQWVRCEGHRTLDLVLAVTEAEARRSVRVSAMRGVDEDMRDWSLCMILEHNAIVTRELTRVMTCLARGESVERRINPKTDVMPSGAPGREQVEAFQASIDGHLAAVDRFQPRKGTATFPHPIFGDLDAHGFNCMTALHLEVHRKQAERVVKMLRAAA